MAPTLTSPTPPTGPSPTPPPVDPEGRRDLSEWVLLYTTTDTNVPFTNDIAQVVNITDIFLSDYFFDLFGRVNFATLDDFVVMYVNSQYNRDGPNEIQYSAVAYFDKNSATIPQASDLDVLLRQAFVGASLANYTRLIRELPESNPFSTTMSVAYSNSTTRSSVQGAATSLPAQKKSLIAGTLVAMAAVAAVIGGFFIYKKRSNSEERKSLVHGHFSFGGTAATPDETTALSLEPMPPNLQTLKSPMRSVYVDEGFDSLADSATYTADGDEAVDSIPRFEPMSYDDEFDVNANLQPGEPRIEERSVSSKRSQIKNVGYKGRELKILSSDASTSSSATSNTSNSKKSAPSSNSSSSSSSADAVEQRVPSSGNVISKRPPSARRMNGSVADDPPGDLGRKPEV